MDTPMSTMFEGYPARRGPAYDEMFDADHLRPPYERSADVARRPDDPRPRRPGRGAAGELPRPGRHLRHRRRGAGLPARHPAAGDRDGHLVDDRARRPAAGARAGGVPRRRVRRRAGLRRRRDPAPGDRDLVALPPRRPRGCGRPNGVRVHVSGIDLVRDDDGEFRVLEDNVRVPSGVSYVMTNRRAISSALPEPFAEHRIRPVAGYPQRLLAALRAAAPAGVADPTVVVLTPGVYNGAYFEHALLARTMGVELRRGPRPGVPPRPGDDAHHHGPRAGARDLPPRRRRVPRPGALPRRLDARLPRPHRRGPRRQRHASPTRSATGSPTTSSSTPTCPT